MLSPTIYEVLNSLQGTSSLPILSLFPTASSREPEPLQAGQNRADRPPSFVSTCPVT